MRIFIILLLCGSTGLVLAGQEDLEKYRSYKEVELRELVVQMEHLKNHNISYQGRYLGLQVTFFHYMTESGIEADDHWGLLIGDRRIPVIAKKRTNKELADVLPALKRGTTVKVYGRVKKFREEPRQTRLPHYYVELRHLEVLEEAPQQPAAGADAENRPRRGGKRRGGAKSRVFAHPPD